jgi:uncharacterized protein (TIGR02117 family)
MTLKKTIIKVLKYIGKIFLFFIAFVVLYLSAAWILSGITVEKEKGKPEQMAIYISTNGVHTDIVMPVKTTVINWSETVKYSQTAGKDTAQNYIAIGWGDKRFFLDVPDWNHVKISIAIEAALGVNSTAMHTTYLKNIRENKYCKKIMLSEKQYQRLVQYILQYFKRDEKGCFINIVTPNTYGNTDAFYEANGRYHLFFTCNTWTNTALKTAGLKACLWTPFQQGIFRQYEK